MAYRFARARGFAEIPADRPAMGKMGPLTWLQAPSFIQDADTKLELGGQLMNFYAANGITWEPVRAMSEQEWNAFLRRTKRSEVWRAFSERASSGIRYTILVEYDEVHFAAQPADSQRHKPEVENSPKQSKRWWQLWKR